MQRYDDGFIFLHRSILNWGWYSDLKTKTLFIHLLLTVNFAPADWNGRRIEAGQRVTSLAKLSWETGLTIKEIRTCLRHLQRTQEVACETTPQYTVITVKNYEKYQRGASDWANERAHAKANEGQAKGKAGANEGQLYNNNNNNNKNNNIGAVAASPSVGDQLPAVGDGPNLLEIDGIGYRFPDSWYQFAEQKGMAIEDYVRWRNQ